MQTADVLSVLTDMRTRMSSDGMTPVSLFTNVGDRFLLDREDDPDAFYPAEGWLKVFYQDWEIVEYTASSVPLIGKTHEDGTPMTSVVERIIARRPRENG